MALASKTYLVYEYFVTCDCCGETAGPRSMPADVLEFVASLGWRATVGDSGITDLCDDCYALAEQEKALGG